MLYYILDNHLRHLTAQCANSLTAYVVCFHVISGIHGFLSGHLKWTVLNIFRKMVDIGLELKVRLE